MPNWKALFCTVVVIVSTVPAYLSAGRITSMLPVSLTVQPNCQFLKEGIVLSFGTYDPVTSNISTDKDGLTNFQLRCVKDTSVKISINEGLYPVGQVRRMKGGGGYLQYQLYTNAARSSVWNLSNTVEYIASNPAAKSFTIYGRIPAGQDVSSGAYSDTVTVSVAF